MTAVSGFARKRAQLRMIRHFIRVDGALIALAAAEMTCAQAFGRSGRVEEL